jgi:undecaprenyl-diphosphatase
VGLGLAGLGLAAVPSLRHRPPAWETSVFHGVNGLPDGVHAPVWAVMQLGAVGAAPAAAAVAAVTGRPVMARRMLVGGVGAWALSKVAKRIVRRGRPAAVLGPVHVRGRDAGGDGFLSGHAGVSMVLALAASSTSSRPVRAVMSAVPAAVGLARVYVGAHLPLDVLGGWALGLAIDGALRLGDDESEARP